MSLAVLSDEVIRSLLESLTHEDVETLTHTLKCALHEYSTGTQSIEAGLVHQPNRTSIHSNATNATTLFMPSASAAGHGVKVVTVTSPDADSEQPAIKPTGSITLFSPQGTPIGFLHAQTLTAFRTALASSCLLQKRQTVKTLTVFGSGLQAYWHIRLALLLRGSTIRTINIVNRRFSESAKGILKKFYAIPSATKEREGWADARFSLLTPGYGEFGRLLKDHVRAADVIYCCTPSTEPLFEAGLLTNHEGRRKGRLIVAVGIYAPGMRELPAELLHQATRGGQGHQRHFHKHALEGGVVIVDTLDGALKEAGEVIEAGLEPRQLVELGELAMIRKAVMREEEESLASESSRASTDLSSDLDNLSFQTGSSAMSTVFGSACSQSNDSSSQKQAQQPTTPSSSSRTSSPHRTHSGFFHSHKRRSSSQGSVDRAKQGRDDHLARWLTGGNVIFKSVGLGLMDLVVGMEVIELAKKKGVGSYIENFSS